MGCNIDRKSCWWSASGVGLETSSVAYSVAALLLLLFAAATGVAASLLSTAAARSLSLILFFGDSNDAAGLSSCDNALAERCAVAAQAGSSANNFGNFWSSK